MRKECRRMPKREISFLFMSLHDLPPNKEVTGKAGTATSWERHGRRAATGISPVYCNPENTRRIFDTFLAAFNSSVLFKKFLCLATEINK